MCLVNVFNSLMSQNFYQSLYGPKWEYVYDFRDSTDEEQTIFEKSPERKKKPRERKTWFKNKSPSGYSHIDAGADADDESQCFNFWIFI